MIQSPMRRLYRFINQGKGSNRHDMFKVIIDVFNE